MDDALEELKNKLDGKVTFFSYKIKDSVAFVTVHCRDAMIDKGIDVNADLVLLVFFENNDLFEFAFDDFEYKGEYIKFYNKDAVVILKVKQEK